MSQHDFDIANQTASNARADINDALQALASLSAGASAPAKTYANMLWYDSSNNILKMRSEADDAWIDIGTLNQSTNTFEVSGLSTLSEATWEAGTSTTESLVSPAKVSAALNSELQDFAEGAPGAPKVASVSLQGLYVATITIKETTPIGVNDIGNFEQIVLDGSFYSLGTRVPQIRFSSDNGTTFGAYQDIADLEGLYYGKYVITKTSQQAKFSGSDDETPSKPLFFTKSLSIPLDANAFQIRSSGFISDPDDHFNFHTFITGGR